ncbi:hypothetical protein KW794_00470 [Candidatus Saccharibacteria bacterium]|nr:hypothetical protein [Candidatus Saccharibacteria bacterium]
MNQLIKARTPFIILLGVVSFDLFYIYVVILWLKPLYYGGQQYIPLAVLSILILAYLLVWLVQFNRLQLLIIVHGDYLTTISLYGKRTIKLPGIVSIKRVEWFPAAKLPSGMGCLKVTDSDGSSLYVQFGVLSEKRRRLLYDSLKTAFEKPKFQQDQGVSRLWNSWYGFVRKQS